MIDRRVMLLVALLAAACDSTKKDCEHARDAFVAEWEQQSKEALATLEPGQRKTAEASMAKETALLRDTFVDTCVAQPQSTHACVAKIDEILKMKRDGRAARDRCASNDTTCRVAATDAAKAAAGECDAAIDELLKAVLKL